MSEREIVRRFLETAAPDATAQELLDDLPETPAFRPHVVHSAGGGRRAQAAIDVDGEGEKVAKRTGSTHTGLDYCPDCHRGLTSRGDLGMVCSRLGNDEPLSACHAGCAVACGLED